MRFIGGYDLGMRMAQWMGETGLQPLERSAERGIIQVAPHCPKRERDAFLDTVAAIGWQANQKDPLPPEKSGPPRFDVCKEAVVIARMREAGAFDAIHPPHPLGDAWLHAAYAGELPSVYAGPSKDRQHGISMDSVLDIDLDLHLASRKSVNAITFMKNGYVDRHRKFSKLEWRAEALRLKAVNEQLEKDLATRREK